MKFIIYLSLTQLSLQWRSFKIIWKWHGILYYILQKHVWYTKIFQQYSYFNTHFVIPKTYVGCSRSAVMNWPVNLLTLANEAIFLTSEICIIICGYGNRQLILSCNSNPFDNTWLSFSCFGACASEYMPITIW